MKILFVSALLPYPLYSGGQIRIYHLLARLAKQHEITLFSFIRAREEANYRENLSFCRRVETVYRGSAWQPQYVARAVLGKYPLLLASYNNQEMRQKLAQELAREQYDVIHLEPFYVWPSLPPTTLPVVVAEHNIEYQVYADYVRRFPIAALRPLLYSDVLKLRFWEEKIWQKAAQVITVSAEDKSTLRQKLTGGAITVIPNGADPKLFTFQPGKNETNSPVFLFVGNFAWLPNRDSVKVLIKDIWPLLRQYYPTGKLRIVGKNAPDFIARLADQPGITLASNVSDVSREYRQAHVLLAPGGIGGGTKFKILEAWASGVPVITSLAGIKGLEARNGKEVLLAQTPEEFVGQIDRILQDKDKRDKLTHAARALIEQKYSWDKLAGKLSTVWEKAHETRG